MSDKSSKKPIRNPEVLLSKVKQNFPELKCKNFRYIDEGWDHEILIVDDKYVFRFPNDAEYRGKLKQEISILKHIAPMLAANIPNYDFIAPDGSFAGYPIVPGQIISLQMFKALSKEERSSLTRQVAEFLTTLHQLLEKNHQLPTLPEEYMYQHFRDSRKNALEHLPSALSSKDFQKVEAIISDMEKVLEEDKPSVFLHGDLYHKHILWDDKNQKLGVIDFSDMTIGDPAIDFAELYEYGRGFAVDVYQKYCGIKGDDFMRRAWIYEKWVSVFLMANHFEYKKYPFEEIRKLFDTLKNKSEPDINR